MGFLIIRMSKEGQELRKEFLHCNMPGTSLSEPLGQGAVEPRQIYRLAEESS